MRVANIQTIKAENRANNVYKSPSNSYGSYYIGSLDDLALENRSDTGQEVYVDNFGLTRQNDVQTIMYSYMPDYAGGAERDLMRWQEGQHKTAYVYGLSGLVAQKTSHITGEVHPMTGAVIDTSGSHKNIYSDIAVEIGILYHHENRLGSSDYITDANGGIRAWSAYDEWGLPSYGTSYNMNTAGIISSASFTGYDWDNVLGVYFAQYRFYDPENKRFMSEDPIKSGRNWYAYCDNNPVMWVDPWGLKIVLVGDWDYADLQENKDDQYKNKFMKDVLAEMQKLTGYKLDIDPETNEVTRESYKSASDPSYATGDALIRLLVDSDKTVQISYASKSMSSAKPTDSEAAKNGTGSHSLVYFGWNVYYELARDKSGFVTYEVRPAHITLGHELIHALFQMQGERETENIAYGYTNIGGNTVAGVAGLEELMTSGIGGYWRAITEYYDVKQKKTIKITENALREEQGYNLREAYTKGIKIPMLTKEKRDEWELQQKQVKYTK